MARWSSGGAGTWVGSTGGYRDLTSLGPQVTLNVPAGTSRVRYLWSTVVNTINWPGARLTDSFGVQSHGLYNQFPTTPAQRRWSIRVVSPGVLELAMSGGQDTVAPTPVDVWLVR